MIKIGQYLQKLCSNEKKSSFYDSQCIVTMAVSVAVCEIFSIKKWCKHKNRIRVRLTSLEMVPFDRLHTSSYSSSIVTIALSCILCKI